MDAREKIISAASALIEESAGDIEAITVRAIAQRAGVGVGLINYHYRTKEKLVELCVQRFIGSHIAAFKPDVPSEGGGTARLRAVFLQVADYLAENPAVSQISILGDMKSPSALDNTMKTAMGFVRSYEAENTDQRAKTLQMFSLASVLQGLFLRRDLSAELFGYDFNDKLQRDAMLNSIMDAFLGRD